MLKKEYLAIEYLKLRKEFDGDNFIGRYPTITELCKKFKTVDLEDKIKAVKSVLKK